MPADPNADTLTNLMDALVGEMTPAQFERAVKGMGLQALGGGVWGHEVVVGDSLYYPYIVAKNRGKGEVGRWLDSLPKDKRICFPAVISQRLEGMLVRRGYRIVYELPDEALHSPGNPYTQELGMPNELVEVYVRKAV